MSTAVKRACDACHRRKVKCDGVNPCRNCSSAQLTCTYNAIPQKKGPKGSRAKVISELRETQRATSLSAKVQARMSSSMSVPPCSPSLVPNHGILAPELINATLDFFFANMYTIMPILSRQRLEQQLPFMETQLDTYCMVASLSAFMLLQPGFVVPGDDPLFLSPGANIAASELLIEEATRVRKGYDQMREATLNSLCTNYFLFGCYYTTEQHDKAWYQLREATTISHMLGLTNDESYNHPDAVEGSRRRRLYWQLFIAERAYTLKYGYPMSLPGLIKPTNVADDPTDPLAHQLNNHVFLLNIFRYFDDTFMLFWNKTRNEMTQQHVNIMQKRFSEIPLPYGADSDISANQTWLKGVAWNLSQLPGMSPGSDDMTFGPPMGPPELTSIASQLSPQITDLLGGIPLAAKLLEITCSVVDVLSMMPSSGNPFEANPPQQQLQELLRLVSALRSGEHQLLPLLLVKVHEILPRLANPQLQRMPDNICAQVDIFDGFGNNGMVLSDYSKPEPQFKPEPYSSAPVSRVDEMANDSGSSHGADLNTPFNMGASSPTVMSPNTVDYQQHMTDYNSIPDIMGTMGQSQQQSLSQQQLSQQQHHPGFQQQALQQQQQQQQAFSHHSLHGQMPNSIHTQLGQPMAQQQGMTGMNHQQHNQNHTQGYGMNGGMAQHLMSNILHRTSPPRSNSFNAGMHQQTQQQSTPQMPRTVGEFHALQRTNSDHVSMNTLGMNSMSTEMDFSGL